MSDDLLTGRHAAIPSTPPDVPRRRAPTTKRHTLATVLTCAVAALAMVTGLSVVYAFRHLSGNLNVVALDEDLTDRPDQIDTAGSGKPLNILVMGSDTREGAGNGIDGEGGGGSDTTILLHLSADRERAYGVSIPRDSMVDRPACKRAGTPAEDYQQWNEAFSIGGATCTIQQFEQLTKIRVDHFVVVEFGSFGKMVDAVGGVEICVPEEINDDKANIYLEAGCGTSATVATSTGSNGSRPSSPRWQTRSSRPTHSHDQTRL
jgi:LCP family protein required for cell wall assembly